MASVTAEAIGLLEAFAREAGPPAARPADRRRWHAFLIAAHREGARLGAADLALWLLGRGWDAEAAERLAAEYADARELLRRYDASTGMV